MASPTTRNGGQSPPFRVVGEATVGDWRPTGSHLPQPAVTEALQLFAREVFALFDAAQSAEADHRAA